MFNKNYFNYLLKSKKYLLIFIFLITLLNIFANRKVGDTLAVEGLLALILCYVLPVYFFYYVHDKKAVDSYYSIPVSRNAIVTTGIIFTIASIFLPLLLTFIIYAIKTPLYIVSTLYYCFMILVIVATLVIFNTTIYLIANNVFDGVVMIGAYTVLPLVIWIMTNYLMTTYVAGNSYYDVTFASYLSPVYLSVYSFVELFDKECMFGYLITLLIYLVVFTTLLLVGYKRRDVSRANTPSSKFFAYPLVIYIYVFISMFTIATGNNFEYNGVFDFLKNNFILYVLLFVAFVAAHFVYKRKLYLSYKLPLFFIIAMVISLAFTSIFKINEGFGLSQNYKTGEFMRYNYNIWNQDDKEILDLINEHDDEHSYQYSIFIEAVNFDTNSRNKKIKSEYKKETIDYLESIRQEGISYFYHGPRESNSSFSVDTYDNKNYYSYYYSLESDVSLETLIMLAQDENVSIVISPDNGFSYYLLPDGSLSINNYLTITY